MSLRNRLMGTGNFPTVPSELLEKFNDFPHIKTKIMSLWGTVELQAYFEKLFTDTRGNTRTGFPGETGKALVSLSNIHAKHLESIGIKLMHLEGSEFASKVEFKN